MGKALDPAHKYSVPTDGHVYKERPEMIATHAPYSDDGGKKWVLLSINSISAAFGLTPDLIKESLELNPGVVDDKGRKLKKKLADILDDINFM